MKEMIGNLMASYKTSIDGLTWMGPQDQVGRAREAGLLQVKIGYPDQWRDYSKLEIRLATPWATPSVPPSSSTPATPPAWARRPTAANGA